MRNFIPAGISLILSLLFFLGSFNISNAQAFNFNTFFPTTAIGFVSPDSNNMIYNQLHNANEMVQQLDSIFPYNTSEYYNAYPAIQVSDTISFLQGLHEQIPAFDAKASEIKGAFTLYNKTDYWYAYYKKSVVDTTAAIVIFPGTGYHEGFQVSNNNPNDYHDLGCLIKNKCLQYGDVYVVVKPNEDFRSIWKDTGNNHYNKLDYDVMGPYTDLMGKNWAANLYIELLAQLKYLQSKYKKVIAIGLSNGGFPVLVCGLEAGIDGINCAAGLSVTSYTGFPVSNNENPFFSGLFDYYALDSVSSRIHKSGTQILFSYGSGDCCTNAYEHTSHALQNYINTPDAACNADFFYNFSGHTFPCVALDDFFTKVIQSPKPIIDLPEGNCAYDSLQVSVRLTGHPPFSMDLYKNGYYDRHFTTSDSIINITLYEEGSYYIANLTDAGSYPLCKSENFIYLKPPTRQAFTELTIENTFLVASPNPYMYHWYKDGILIDSTTSNVLASHGSGDYYVLLTDSAGCAFKSNIVTEAFPSNINIYPNPATSYVNVLLNDNFTGVWNYAVYDNLGRWVGAGNSASPHAQINMQEFSRGLYNFCIEYYNKAGEKTRKTIVVYKY